MGLMDLVFPKTCLGCGKEGQYLCPECVAKNEPAKPICPYCEKASIDGMTHAKCARKLGLDGLVSAWIYQGIIQKAILALKYKYATEVGRELINCLTGKLKTVFVPSTLCLVPIPIYWYRQNVRGFNQSVIVGRAVAEVLNTKFEPDLLVRIKSTQPQALLSGEARRQNLRGVFALNSSYLTNQQIIHSSVILFDDVFTTGSTLREAAMVLKRAGVKKVWGLTIAR